MLRREFTSNELPSLIEAVLKSKNMDDRISCLSRDDAQILVDVLDEARLMSTHRSREIGTDALTDQVLNIPDLSLWVRVKCLRRMYRTCGRHGLLPKTLEIPICYDRTGYPRYSGGNADVWEGEYCGRDVAVKVIRTYSSSNLKRVVGVSCWLSSPHVLDR